MRASPRWKRPARRSARRSTAGSMPATHRVPVEMLAEEQLRLHRLPEHPYTAAFGVTRIVGANTPVIAIDDCEYSVPHELSGRDGVGPLSRRPGHRHPCRAGRAGRGLPPRADHPGPPPLCRRPFRADAGRTAAPHPPAGQRGGGGVPGYRVGSGVVADRGRRGRGDPAPPEDGRRRRAGRVCTAPPPSTGRWGTPRCWAVSATATWRRSSPIRPRPAPVKPDGPARTTPCNPAPPRGRGSANDRRSQRRGHHRH